MTIEELRIEINTLKSQMAEIHKLVHHLSPTRPYVELPQTNLELAENRSAGYVYYSGQYQTADEQIRWEPRERPLEPLLDINSEKIAKILSALGSKPRLDIMKSVLNESLTGVEIVEKLGLGTTGQLYHHLKALQGSDLISQDKSGHYTLPDHRKFPLLLLLSAVAEMLDTSDYIDMVEVRNTASSYLGAADKDGFDANLLLWAVLENAILEHVAGYGTEVHIFLHADGGATINDNGRGIPVNVFRNSNKSNVQTVLTDIERFSKDAPYQAPGAEKGISIAVVNALAYSLSVEVRREGYIYRQDYRHGIPLSDLMTVGVTQATGTGITFRPDPELFGKGFDRQRLQQRLEQLASSYPDLNVQLH